MNCRHCHSQLDRLFLDLGLAPLANAYVAPDELDRPELHYPLKLFVCSNCWLVQTQDFAGSKVIFNDRYAYFSSISESWLAHAERYTAMITKRLYLNKDSFVVEIASNDGYLLKNFRNADIRCLGIEPTASTAAAAERLGIEVLRTFFGSSVAHTLRTQGRMADLIIGNNVYAHVQDINDFTLGLKTLLKPAGTITLEFPHLLHLIEKRQFDTVYHEHFSYLSLGAVGRIFDRAGLRVWDVEALPTHGGSLRVYGCHAEDPRSTAASVARTLAQEQAAGLERIATYGIFQQAIEEIKNEFLFFLLQQKRAGKKVAAYGAAAKGTTLLNFAGIRADLISYVCDAAPSKQNMFLPGSHIPIHPPAVLRTLRPDIVIILPWNIADEVARQHNYVGEWGGQFVTALPFVRFVTTSAD